MNKPRAHLAGAAAVVLTAMLASCSVLPGGGGQVGIVDGDLTQQPEVVWTTQTSHITPDWVSVTDGVVTAAGTDGVLTLDSDDGSELWSVEGGVRDSCLQSASIVCLLNPTTSEAELRFVAQDGTTTVTPAPEAQMAVGVDDDAVVLTDADVMQRITSSGEVVWESAPLPTHRFNNLTFVNGIVTANSAQEGSVAVDAETGDLMPASETYTLLPTAYGYFRVPAQVEVNAYYSTGDALDFDGSVIAAGVDFAIDDDPEASISVDRSGDADTIVDGDTVLWSYPENSIVLARLDGIFVSFLDDGGTWLVGTDAGGNQLWRSGDALTSPAFASGSTMVTWDRSGSFTAIDVHTGEVLWSLESETTRTFALTEDGFIVSEDHSTTRYRWGEP